jgi:mRNA-degrading endonuclease toxin of MazEF toxin-antitoxin module
MKLERGQVINARFPHASGGRGKKRPVVVVQTNTYNKRLRHAAVVQLTTNLDDKSDPACFLIEAATPEGRAAGIMEDSLFSGYLISLMSADRLPDVIGKFSEEAMRKVDDCLKAALIGTS